MEQTVRRPATVGGGFVMALQPRAPAAEERDPA
jgi:hypothetical protein